MFLGTCVGVYKCETYGVVCGEDYVSAEKDCTEGVKETIVLSF